MLRRSKRSARRAYRAAAVIATLLLTLLSSPTPAQAHGENTQQAFIRLSTVLFYDVHFSTTNVQVGDELTITGKFRIMDSWPDHTIAPPDIAYLTVSEPGPVFLAEERSVSGQFTPESFKIEKGETYPFKIVLQARKVGRWHVHPALAAKGTGLLLGQGEYVNVRPGGAVANDLLLDSGQTVDLNTFGLGQVVTWHLVGAAIGIVWLLYWIRRPVLARFLEVMEGRSEKLVGKRDRVLGLLLVAAVFAAGIIGNVYTNSHAPHTVPLQVARITAQPEAESTLDSALHVKIDSATYAPEPKPTLTLQVTATNSGDTPTHLSQIQFGETTLTDSQGDSDEKFTTSPQGVVAPGATETFAVTVAGKFLKDKNLIPIDEAQIRITGLLFFEDPSGQRSEVEVNELTSAIRPDFHASAEGS